MLFLIQDQRCQLDHRDAPMTCNYDQHIEGLSLNVYMEILHFELCEKLESATLL